MTRSVTTGCTLLAICAAFAGCSARINVSTTAATPAQFSHVYITAQAVWFNTSANATPDDGGWAKFALKTPVTVDLVTESNGTLGEIATDLRVAPGTYNSILLLPVDPTTALTASANAVGAATNQEAVFVDTAGVSHTVQLVIPNAEKGIVIPGANALTVPVGGTKGGIPIGGASTTNSSNTTNSATNLFGSPTTINPTSTTSSSTTNNTVTVSFASTFDGNRDLHMFSYSPANLTGVVLSSNPASTDLATTGGITGTLSVNSLASLAPITSVSGRLAIQACAESLSADGSHHVVVACAPLDNSGNFTIYPLASNSKKPLSYDVVIHGPHIETIIIKGVVVTTTTPTINPAPTTANGTVATTTATGAVSLGTINPTLATQFPVTASAGTGLPAGAVVTFYQTLGGSGQAPYAIDEVAVDPFNSTTLLSMTENLSAGAIVSGTYSSNGGTITVTSQQAAEGPGTYSVAATAPFYTDGYPSGKTVAAPSSTQGTNGVDSTTPVSVSVPGLAPANGSAAGTLTATITPATPGKYDQGELIVSHNGAVIGSAKLDGTPLASGASVPVPGLPDTTTYYLSVIVWNSQQVSAQNPSVTYQSVTTPVSLSGGSGTAQVTIN